MQEIVNEVLERNREAGKTNGVANPPLPSKPSGLSVDAAGYQPPAMRTGTGAQSPSSCAHSGSCGESSACRHSAGTTFSAGCSRFSPEPAGNSPGTGRPLSLLPETSDAPIFSVGKFPLLSGSGQAAPEIAGVQRINYQKANAGKRLSPLGDNLRSKSRGEHPVYPASGATTARGANPASGTGISPARAGTLTAGEPNPAFGAGNPHSRTGTPGIGDGDPPARGADPMAGAAAASMGAAAPRHGVPGAVPRPATPPGSALTPLNRDRFAAEWLSPLLLRALPPERGGRPLPDRPAPTRPVGPGQRPASHTPPAAPTPARAASPAQAQQPSARPAAGPAPSRAEIAAAAQTGEPLRLAAAGGIEAWLFPRLSRELQAALGIPGRSYTAAGVITSPACTPGQLFASEQLLAGDGSLEADIAWGLDGRSFELKLFGGDPLALGEQLVRLAGELLAHTQQAVCIFTSLNPTGLVKRHFGAGQPSAIAVIEAATRWGGIAIAEQWAGRCPDARLSIRVEHGYCVVSTAAGQLNAALPELQTLAAAHNAVSAPL